MKIFQKVEFCKFCWVFEKKWLEFFQKWAWVLVFLRLSFWKKAKWKPWFKDQLKKLKLKELISKAAKQMVHQVSLIHMLQINNNWKGVSFEEKVFSFSFCPFFSFNPFSIEGESLKRILGNRPHHMLMDAKNLHHPDILPISLCSSIPWNANCMMQRKVKSIHIANICRRHLKSYS